MYIFTTNCWKDENQEKEAWNGPFKTHMIKRERDTIVLFLIEFLNYVKRGERKTLAR